MVMGDYVGNNGGKNHPVDRWMHYTGVWVDPPEGPELKASNCIFTPWVGAISTRCRSPST